MEYEGQEILEIEARILELEMRRDRILETLESLTAEIYSEMKLLDLYKGASFCEDCEDLDFNDGCMA
ncbi:MAG: hypothetical protein WC375_00355 [Methanomassiliicoccales archaeon]|jgi:hypothetical protein